MKEIYAIIHEWNSVFDGDGCFSEEVIFSNKETADKVCAERNKKLEEECSSKETSDDNVTLYLFDGEYISMECYYVKKKVIFESEEDYNAYLNKHKLPDSELPM